MSDPTSVVVALRVRPMNGSERSVRAQRCVKAGAPNQIIIGKDKAFTFDNVYWEDSSQDEIYENSVASLVKSFFDGYNATILAYGQTGSGKTFTMGTAASSTHVREADMGILPRVIKEIFEYVKEKADTGEFSIRCSFLEIHNEDIVDLLDPSPDEKPISIRETNSGEITVVGVEEQTVNSYTELVSCLEDGSMRRATGSTNMNAHSSRSHAIFSIFLSQRLKSASHSEKEAESATDGMMDLVSKFNFVDLAGSERLKKTGAVGERMKEGININCGLLALGNVISALGDPKKRGTHVPFRDSKITRLLQDSLGGNSRTIMIACISPADLNFEESASTLGYANRARNIMNKPVVNRDPVAAKMEALVTRIQILEDLLNKQGISVPDVMEKKDDSASAMIRRMSESFRGGGFSPRAPSESVTRLENEINRLECCNAELQQNILLLQDALMKSKSLKDSYKLKFEKVSAVLSSNNIDPLSVEVAQDQNLISTLNSKIFDLEATIQRITIENARKGSVTEPRIISSMDETESERHLSEDIQSTPLLGDEPIDIRPYAFIKKTKSGAKNVWDSKTDMINEDNDSDIESVSDSVDPIEVELENIHNRTASETMEIVRDIKRRSLLDLTPDTSSVPAPDFINNSSSPAANRPAISPDSNIPDVSPPADFPVAILSPTKKSAQNEDEIYEIASLNLVQDQRKNEFHDDQLTLTRTLKHIDQNVNNKEILVAELLRARETVQVLKKTYEAKIAELEFEVNQVQAERDRVIAEAESQSIQISTSTREKYDRKLKELEANLSSTREKLKENQKLAKSRQQDDSRIKLLQTEIDLMKKQRVTVARQMKDQSDKHRLWVLDTDGQIKALRKSALSKDKELRDVKFHSDQQAAILRRRNDEIASLQNRLKIMEGKRASVVATRMLNSRHRRGSGLPGIHSSFAGVETPQKRLKLRNYALATSPSILSPLNEDNGHIRRRSLIDSSTDFVKKSINEEIKMALRRHDLSLNYSRLQQQLNVLEDDLKKSQDNVIVANKELKQKHSLFDRQEEQRIIDLQPTSDLNDIPSSAVPPSEITGSSIVSVREIERDQMEADRLIERVGVLEEQIAFVHQQIADCQKKIDQLNSGPNVLENLEQILNSNRVPLPDDPTVSESNSNVIPSLATVSSLEQAKWLVMYLTHEVFALKKKRLFHSRAVSGEESRVQEEAKYSVTQSDENRDDTNALIEAAKHKNAAESHEYNQMAQHRVNVFDRLVSESGLVGIHKHKTDELKPARVQSKYASVAGVGVASGIPKRYPKHSSIDLDEDLVLDHSVPFAAWQASTFSSNSKQQSRKKAHFVQNFTGIQENFVTTSAPNSPKKDTPANGPMTLIDLDSLPAHLDLAEPTSRSSLPGNQNSGHVGNVFSRLTEKTSYTGISKYAATTGIQSAAPPVEKSILKPKTAKIDPKPEVTVPIPSPTDDISSNPNNFVPVHERLFHTKLESKKFVDVTTPSLVPPASKRIAAVFAQPIRPATAIPMIRNKEKTIKSSSVTPGVDGSVYSLGSGEYGQPRRDSDERNTNTGHLADVPLSEMFSKHGRVSSDSMSGNTRPRAESSPSRLISCETPTSDVNTPAPSEVKLAENFDSLTKELDNFWNARQ